jgi:mono/diheme cytochrome c family protein
MKDYFKFYGFIYLIVIIGIIIMGTMYVNDLPFEFQQKIGGLSPVKSADSVVQADLPIVKGTLSAPVDVNKYLNPTPDLIEKGKSIYNINCASCHGEQGLGDGVAGASLNPKPRNFHEMNGWTNGPALTMMYKTLQEGITNRGMASYSTMPPEDRLDIIMYIRTFSPNYPPITKTQIDSIDLQYSLSKGIKQPNQIPVKLASEKIIQQNLPIENKVANIIKYFDTNKNDSNVILFNSIVNNKTKALTVLAYDSAWQSSQAALVKVIENNPGQNGFKPRAFYILNSQQFSLLHEFLKKLFITN